MSSYFNTSRLFKAAAIVLGGSGTAYGIKHYFLDEKSATTDSKPTAVGSSFIIPEINASWTTNHKPSVPWDHNWDKREPISLLKPNKNRNKELTTIDTNNNFDDENDAEKLKELIPKASRHLILIRHGQYHDKEKKDEAQILTKLGQEQADLTGARLKELGYPYSVMVNSTMSRAVETASIISKHLKEVRTISTDLLREGAPIPPEPPVGHWRPEVHQFHRDGSRIEAAFRQFFHRADVKQTEDSYEILVCHANVIRYFVCRALQFPPEAWLRISLHHASITWIVVRPNGRVSIYNLGDCGHMPPDKLSYR